MKFIKKNTKRITIKLNLYKNKKLVDKFSSMTKTRIIKFLQGKKELEYDFGVCKVIYDSNRNLYNKFYFNNFEQFKEALEMDIEKPLINYILGGEWE